MVIAALILGAAALGRGCRVTVDPASVKIASYLMPPRTIQRRRIGTISRRRDGLGFADASGTRLAWCAGVWDDNTLDALRSAVFASEDAAGVPEFEIDYFAARARMRFVLPP